MPNYCHNCLLLLAVSVTAFSFGCSANIEAPKISYAAPVKDSAAIDINPAKKNNEAQINLEEEAEIEKMCLAAWRKCVAGDKKAGVAELKKLSKQYPRSSSVLFMTGQVLERFGDKKEALDYYEKAANNSDFAAMSLFKIAESLASTGNTEQAIIRYRKLINIAPQFSLAHLGLAKALIKLQPHSAEAKKELEKTLELEPSNKEAQAMLSSIHTKIHN